AMPTLRGDSVYLFERRHTLFYFLNSIAAQRHHSARRGHVAELIQCRAVADQVEALVVRHEKLIDADSAGVAEVSAARTPARAEEFFDRAGEFLDLPLFVQRGLVFFLAALAELAHQALGEHAADGGADQVRLDAEVVQTRDRTRRVVRVQRAQN